jgi:divalent metal cation (Fe/Co/Zn/Cd) transporter
MQESALYRKAYVLAIVTVVYNIIEGLVSTGLGADDETLALFGFGLDSFIESISGVGVLLMIRRLTAHGPTSRTEAEKTALRVTGYAFYALAFMLIATSVMGIYHGHVPESTQWGVVVGSISIATMWWLVYEKRKIATVLDSAPLRADANCTMVCIYMSISILASSLVFELTGFAYADVLGAIAITWFSISEGRECFEKAKGHECSCETECA